MTCIVCLETPEGAWIGADSFVGNEHFADRLAGSKLIQLAPDLIVSVTGALRVAQIISYGLRLPEKTGNDMADDEAWLFKLGNAVQIAMGDHDHLCHGPRGDAETSIEGQSTIPLVYRGRAYELVGSFAIKRSARGYNCNGSGFAFAYGSLSTTARLDVQSEDRVRLALQAAAENATTVAAPFDIRFQARS